MSSPAPPSGAPQSGAPLSGAPFSGAPLSGAGIIAATLATLPATPGVYRMLDARGEALYVGKARALSKRVAAYTQPARLPERLRRMVSETRAMEIITTHTEAEANGPQ